MESVNVTLANFACSAKELGSPKKMFSSYFVKLQLTSLTSTTYTYLPITNVAIDNFLNCLGGAMIHSELKP